MRERYKQDAAYELSGIEARLKSARRTLRDTANANTVKAKEGDIRALERQLEALRLEVATLPERPPRVFNYGANGSQGFSRTTPFTEAELAALEIPAFLKRAA